MFKLITPIILILIAVAAFFTFTKPLYESISTLKGEAASYDEALSNSKALESERDKLTQKYNAIGSENLSRLAKLIPESVDNIRLILEIEKLAKPYGMVLKDVKYDTVEEVVDPKGITQALPILADSRKGYGVWNLEFSIEGSYDNFMAFLGDMENNLRLVEVESVSFSSNTGGGPGANVYKYGFKIKTYWLKN